jgi:hypothetical protein
MNSTDVATNSKSPEKAIVDLLLQNTSLQQHQLAQEAGTPQVFNPSTSSSSTVAVSIFSPPISANSSSSTGLPRPSPQLYSKLSSLNELSLLPLRSKGPSSTGLENPFGSNEQRNAYYIQLQFLLMNGNREEALNYSLEHHDWSSAMMLASLIGSEKYQEIIRLYCQSYFTSISPLHFVSMLYSNQGLKMLLTTGQKNIPKFISSTSSSSSSSTSAVTSTVTDDLNNFNLIKNWKMTLASILSNKTSDWELLVLLLGYRLQHDEKVLSFLFCCFPSIFLPFACLVSFFFFPFLEYFCCSYCLSDIWLFIS